MQADYPDAMDKVVFSHSLTSMNENDAYTINALEVKTYKLMRTMLRVLPA